MTEKTRVVLNSAAVVRMLKSAGVRRELRKVADRIAAGVDDQHLVASSGWARIGIPPEIKATVVEDLEADRARATVQIQHPAARAMQAKHGVMSKAASAAGVTPHT